MEKTKLESMLRQEPLLMEGISRDFIDWPSLQTASHPSLFFGVGLCTSREPATAIPFDILSFFFLAEKLRRELDLDTIFVLIADTHAKTNTFMTEKLIRKLSVQMKSAFTTLLRNLHLKHFKIVLGSDIHKDTKAPTTYLSQEIADLVWFTTHKNVRLKLGWAINNDPIAQGHDERFFDAQIRDTETLPLSFVHCKAGRTFDVNRPKTSPYISVAGESRIILANSEQVKLPVNTEVTRATLNHLSSIVRLFESLFVRIPKKTLEEKIQFITDLCTHS